MKEMKVVGRAELKLLGAVEAFAYDFRGKTVLDIGSSTGGFTELALRLGAERVIAVEKGTKQMKVPLRFDPKVELHEKTDFLALRSGHLSGERRPTPKDQNNQKIAYMSQLSDGIDMENEPQEQGPNESELVNGVQVQIDLSRVQTVVADVSFVSLRKILAHAQKIVPRGADYLVMLKPQFEAFPDQLVNGVVKNEKIRREIMRSFEQWLGRNGFRIVKKRDNEVRGKVGGNRERFYWLR